MLNLLKKADLRIINLENAIAKSGKPWSKTSKVFFYRADPNAIDVLKAAKIDCVTLANNHVLDYDYEALIETLEHLEKNKIAYAGAGRNLIEAEKPVFIGVKGIKIEKSIREVKNKSDVTIVSAHWGPNMRQRPTKQFKELARAVIDAGADIFHSHSAHIFQGIEIYKNI